MSATPAERLIAAADRLDMRATCDLAVFDCAGCKGDAALAVVLRTEAERISGTTAFAVAFDGSPLHPARADILALADLLLAGVS